MGDVRRIDLQFFADDLGDSYDDFDTTDFGNEDDVDDVDVDSEDVETDDLEDVEGEEPVTEGKQPDVKGDKSQQKGKEDTGKGESSFSPEQQAKVDQIVKTRLERAETSRLKELSGVAGSNLSSQDVVGATRLWGLLLKNPELSRAIDNLIDQETRVGRIQHVTHDSAASKAQELAVKEALIDLRASDKLFNRNSKAILEWAEDQGFTVTDKKSLQLAYMAWKGANDKVLSATQALRDKQKAATKQAMKGRASVESSTGGGKRQERLNYRKMSDADILASEGLSLFTDAD